MTQDLRTLIETMAIKLDVMTQMLKDDRSLTDPLADRARAALAVEAVERLPDGAQIIEPTERTVLVPAPRPIPVSDRLPGAEDCDAEGRCWLLLIDGESGAWCWILDRPDAVSTWAHWLPAHALPIPENADD